MAGSKMEGPSAPALRRDPYEVLCVSRDSSDHEIKTAYRKLALKYHPDKNASNPEVSEHFKEVAYSYSILSDPEKRRQYDNAGFEALDADGMDMEIDLSNLGTVNTMFAAPFSKRPEKEPDPQPELMEEVFEEEREAKEQKAQAQKEKEAGNAAYKKRDFETAIQHYTKARELDEEDISFLTNRAAVDLEMGKTLEKETDPNPTPYRISFSDLGLANWAVQTCKELGIKKPTPVQHHCIPRILAGQDVLAIAHTGSGKTAAFALPMLHRLSEDPYGVFALVLTPSRELASDLADQFRALGSGLNLRCAVIRGGFDMITQSQTLMQRPHVVIATPGRLKVLIEENSDDIRAVFSNTKFLVLDEADRILDVQFEEELRAVFQCLPKNRQTLLFSATMTSDLQTLLELSANKAYFYKAYEDFEIVESLKQQYVFIPKNVKDVYLFHILSNLEGMAVRSAIIFVSTCRSCELLSLLLDELDVKVAGLHSLKSQSLRLAALHKFKSGQVPILLATDLASRGLDIPTVDLVVNYDIPRCACDYVHRVGRTARAGRGGHAISFVTQNDVDLIHEIEADLQKKLEKFECKENDVLGDITKVYKAKRVATMKMMDDGFDEKEKARKAQTLKSREEKGLLKNTKKRRRKTPK